LDVEAKSGVDSEEEDVVVVVVVAALGEEKARSSKSVIGIGVLISLRRKAGSTRILISVMIPVNPRPQLFQGETSQGETTSCQFLEREARAREVL
jgi:hypothetical protein